MPKNTLKEAIKLLDHLKTSGYEVEVPRNVLDTYIALYGGANPITKKVYFNLLKEWEFILPKGAGIFTFNWENIHKTKEFIKEKK